jgi:hypothetical protein
MDDDDEMAADGGAIPCPVCADEGEILVYDWNGPDSVPCPECARLQREDYEDASA